MWTGTGINIDKRLEDGRTKLFKSELEAKAYADQTRSYPYQVFDNENKHAGYAVPK